MDNIYTSLSLSLLADKRFALNCENGRATVDSINEYILKPLSVRYMDIDLTKIFEDENDDDHVRVDDLAPKEPLVVFWRNADKISKKQQTSLVRCLNEIDEYDTNESRLKKSQLNNHENGTPAIAVENSSTVSSATQPVPYHSNSSIQSPLTIILVIANNLNVIQQLKYKFWFCQYYSSHTLLKAPTNLAGKHYLSQLRKLQRKKVFVAPDIQRYIYSLIVHTRNHRLCLITPMETRLPTMTIHSVQLLAESYVRWSSMTNTKEQSNDLFVTPDVCKIALRKVAYWLINWTSGYINGAISGAATKQQADPVLKREEKEEEEVSRDEINRDYREEKERIHDMREGDDFKQAERMEVLKIVLLGGDWYGTDWKFIQNYIQRCAEKDIEEYNVIVEDALLKVQPPL